jgi:LPXTG-site transpeptidase (sortase) family protein
VTARLVAALLAATLILAACGGASATDVDEAGSLEDVPAFADGDAAGASDGPVTRPTSELAALIQPGGSASTLPETAVGPMPVAMSFEAIGASFAPVVPVGVEPNGDMEIPGAREVGWYQYGPTPGAAGSSVLAAHIAWNGVDGVFRHLTRAEPGQQFTVSFDDGSIAAYEVVAIRQYPKDQLPDELFVTSGDPQVVLITCGGSFNRALNSYNDNIVAYAVPV